MFWGTICGIIKEKIPYLVGEKSKSVFSAKDKKLVNVIFLSIIKAPFKSNINIIRKKLTHVKELCVNFLHHISTKFGLACIKINMKPFTQFIDLFRVFCTIDIQ